NVPHNEWIYRRATWPELVFVNAQSAEEACIPRMFLGEISRVDEPVAIIRLNRELEWKAGHVSPRRRPVIELPVAVNAGAQTSNPHPNRPAPVINIRLEPPRTMRTGQKIGVALILGAVAWAIIAGIAPSRSGFRMNSGDGYFSVVHKLGTPAGDRSVSLSGGLVYRILTY